VRAGHHCAMPVHEKFGIASTTRASFYLYNTKEEVDHFIEAWYKVKEIFG
jgi:cysteine desulfurase/selenocysteine lyase